MGNIIWVVDWDGEGINDAFPTLSDAAEFVLAKIAEDNCDYDAFCEELDRNYSNQGFEVQGWVYCYPVRLHD